MKGSHVSVHEGGGTLLLYHYLNPCVLVSSFVFPKQNLQDGACSNGDGGATSIRGRGDNRDGHACKEAAGGSGNGGSSVQDMEIAKSENREHPAYAGVRAFKEVWFAFEEGVVIVSLSRTRVNWSSVGFFRMG